MFTTSPPAQQDVEPSHLSRNDLHIKSSLNDQLSQAWEVITRQEKEQRNKEKQTMDITKNTNYDVNSEPEIIFVNVWEN